MLTTRGDLAPQDRGGLLATLLVILAVLALLRLAALAANGTDLFFDESQYWSWSREPAFGYYSKPPLIAWIIAAATPVCGDGEFCIRVPSLILHAATSLVVYGIARSLYDEQTGFWSGVVYALLPGVSVSSGIISTDVPLLLAWALALAAFVQLLRRPSYAWAILLGVALGLGLNAKYAMAFFPVCAAVYFWLAPQSRGLLRRPHLWLALLIAALLILPNLLWNAHHQFATFAHTADNAKWEGSLLHPGKALEFLAAQLGVFGPVLFAALAVVVWRIARRHEVPSEADRLLLAFSLPVLAVFTAQALISRAHANWAAVAYVSATILVTSRLLASPSRAWLNGSLVLHAAFALLLALATWQAGRFAFPGVGDPFARTLGNRELASLVRQEIAKAADAGRPVAAILSDERELTAGLLYYGRDIAVPIYAWRPGPRPRDHFELTRAYGDAAPAPVLLVTRRTEPRDISERFDSAEALGPRTVPAGSYATRTVHLFRLAGFRPGT